MHIVGEVKLQQDACSMEAHSGGTAGGEARPIPGCETKAGGAVKQKQEEGCALSGGWGAPTALSGGERVYLWNRMR